MTNSDKRLYDQGVAAYEWGLARDDNPLSGAGGPSRDGWVWLAGYNYATNRAAETRDKTQAQTSETDWPLLTACQCSDCQG